MSEKNPIEGATHSSNEVYMAAPVNEEENGGVQLIDFFIVFAKRKRMVLAVPLLAVALALAVVFMMPRYYVANAKLLPPQQAQSGAAALLSQLGGVAGAAAGATGIKSPNDVYVGMLKSRSIADKLIERFKLKQMFGTLSQEQARRALADRTSITVGKDGLMLIEVESADRKLAPALANGYVDELISLTSVLAVTEASQRRLFFERQLDTAKNNLAQAEISLKNGLESRGVVSVDSDSRAIIETVASLRARASSKEVQLNAMKAFVTPDNQDFKRAQEELLGLRAELSKLENGRPESQRNQQGNSVGLESIKTLRDVKYYQMLYELLSKQYEVARLDEAKETATIQVLDAAIEPENPSRPRRLLVVLLAGLLGLLASLTGALILEADERARSSATGAAKRIKLRQFLLGKRT
jgi:tyrosine-protein kinase Etk/Wzc